jgi:hypothetical protein
MDSTPMRRCVGGLSGSLKQKTKGERMHDVTYTASVFAEDTQQEVKVIAHGQHYASIEVPKEELQLTRAQLLAVGEACYQLADTMLKVQVH